jgi:hypothetical protein
MRSPRAVTTLLLALTLTSACASTPSYRYAPSPVAVLIQPDIAQPALARAEVAARGLSDSGSVLFRVLIESYSDAPLELVPEELRLVDGDLRPFGSARVVRDEDAGAGAGLTIAPRELAAFEVSFAFGADEEVERRLESLVFVWSLRYPDGVASISSRFERVRRVSYRYDPYYAGDPYWDDAAWGRGHRVYGGATIVIRH